MQINTLLNISPIDGRYRKLTNDISSYFSEYAYIKYRIKVEIEWLKYVLNTKEIVDIKVDTFKLDSIYDNFSLVECERVKEIENTTNHDVKAIEYYIKEKLKNTEFEPYSNFVHYLCTSEDINNLAYNLMIADCLNDVVIPTAQDLISNVKTKAIEYRKVAMLSHTHGQPATPTTIGKELAVFVYRWNYILNKIKEIRLKGKFNGATGTFSAHVIAHDINWIEIMKGFVESFGMEYNPLVTQVESHDVICELFNYIKLFNNITLDFNSDMWLYISMGYFKQKVIATETGSSVMPHKVNPINHENSMANIHMANSIIDNFTNNLQISRMQRDLSDSSNLRNIGVMLAHFCISIKQSNIAFSKMEINEYIINKELDDNPEVIAEAIQTILRKNGYDNAYEKLKEITRGKSVKKEDLDKFILSLNINEVDKKLLLKTIPQNYTGLADKLVDYII